MCHSIKTPTIGDECVGCGLCVSVCPVEAIRLGLKAVIDPGTCTGCRRCVLSCPVSAIGPPHEREALEPAATPTSATTDVAIVGAGLGGLLAAVAAASSGLKVTVFEAMAFPGGRFTTVQSRLVAANTGAVHMVPHGNKGPFARLTRSLALRPTVTDPGMLVSLRRNGREYVLRRILDIWRFLGPRDYLAFLRILLAAKLSRGVGCEQSFAQWLACRHAPASVRDFWDAWCRFGISLTTADVTFGAMRHLMSSVRRLGGEGIVSGGCGKFTADLVARAEDLGVDVRLAHSVKRIRRSESLDGYELVIDERGTGTTSAWRSRLVIADTGYEEALELMGLGIPEGGPRPRARGMKLQIVTPVSAIEHRGILLCPAAKRVGGIVQPTNAVPELTAAGLNLILAHQVLLSDDVEHEMQAGLVEVAEAIGTEAIDQAVSVEACAYTGRWPVNRAAQGADYGPRLPGVGIYAVGDSCKPAGYLMVEGVAASVSACLSAMLEDGLVPKTAQSVLRQHVLSTAIDQH